MLEFLEILEAFLARISPRLGERMKHIVHYYLPQNSPFSFPNKVVGLDTWKGELEFF